MIKVPGKVMFPHQFLKKLFVTWNWALTSGDNETYKLRIRRYSINVTPYYFNTIYGEWLDWKRYYLPFKLEGATILDVGSGCGETAMFYFLHGARRVVCVEPHKQLSEILERNIISNRWNAEVLKRPFGLDLLRDEFDFMKMDCEGCETQLLSTATLPRCVIEVHDPTTLSALKQAFDLSLGIGSVQYLIATSPRKKRPVSSESSIPTP